MRRSRQTEVSDLRTSYLSHSGSASIDPVEGAAGAGRTLQDRLVEELRLEGISDMVAANAFRPGFAKRYNRRFTKMPHQPDDLHRPLNVGPDRLRTILCLREHRYVSA